MEFIDRTSLLGPVERVAEGLRRYADGGVTTLNAIHFGDGGSGMAMLRRLMEARSLAGLDT